MKINGYVNACQSQHNVSVLGINKCRPLIQYIGNVYD